MRLSLVLVALALISASDESYARGRPSKACSAEIGMREARALIQDCLGADPATPALCRDETSCDGLREMIEEACRVRPTDKPVCRARRENDEDDEDDEDESE